MTDRDELVNIIFGRSDWSDPMGAAEQSADAILAAGYRKPHTITTVDELFDLTHGTVILHGGEAYRVFRWGTDPDRLDLMEFCNEMTDVIYSGKRKCGYLPATVLYTPEETA